MWPLEQIARRKVALVVHTLKKLVRVLVFGNPGGFHLRAYEYSDGFVVGIVFCISHRLNSDNPLNKQTDFILFSLKSTLAIP